jgi:hypothetical protein
MYSLRSLLILSALLLLSSSIVAVTGNKIKIHLNYNNHDEELTRRGSVSVTNTHTGSKVSGVGNTVSSRVSMENLKDVEHTRSAPMFYSKVDRRLAPVEYIHEQRSLDENFRQPSVMKQQQQKQQQQHQQKMTGKHRRR